jgi:hypothetical protein
MCVSTRMRPIFRSLDFLTLIEAQFKQTWHGDSIGMEQRWQSEGEDRNRAMAEWVIIDSDNKICLMILKKITI